MNICNQAGLEAEIQLYCFIFVITTHFYVGKYLFSHIPKVLF